MPLKIGFCSSFGCISSLNQVTTTWAMGGVESRDLKFTTRFEHVADMSQTCHRHVADMLQTKFLLKACRRHFLSPTSFCLRQDRSNGIWPLIAIDWTTTEPSCSRLARGRLTEPKFPWILMIYLICRVWRSTLFTHCVDCEYSCLVLRLACQYVQLRTVPIILHPSQYLPGNQYSSDWREG